MNVGSLMSLPKPEPSIPCENLTTSVASLDAVSSKPQTSQPPKPTLFQRNSFESKLLTPEPYSRPLITTLRNPVYRTITYWGANMLSGGLRGRVVSALKVSSFLSILYILQSNPLARYSSVGSFTRGQD